MTSRTVPADEQALAEVASLETSDAQEAPANQEASASAGQTPSPFHFLPAEDGFGICDVNGECSR